MRDIEKDKKWFTEQYNPAALYWIAQYEAAQAEISELRDSIAVEITKRCEETYEAYAKLQKEYELLDSSAAAEEESLRARIRELESQLQLHNRPDVVTRQSHDKALYGILQEMEGMQNESS